MAIDVPAGTRRFLESANPPLESWAILLHLYGPAQCFSPSGDGDGEALPGILIV